MPFKGNQNRRDRIPVQRHRVLNWPAYEAGLRARRSLTVWFTAETLEVPRPRHGCEPVHLLVDSTGLKLCGPDEWLGERQGTRTRRGWRKLVWGLSCQALIAATPSR